MEQTLQKLDFSPKEAKIYLALLQLGPSSLRKIASHTALNRGSAYDTLKSLTKRGLVSFYDKGKRQHFVAEDPENLVSILREKRRGVAHAKKELARVLPGLRALFEKGGEKPSVKLYEGNQGAKVILEDILRTMAKEREKEYCVYSSVNIRNYLYQDFASFSDRRIALGIRVKVIALGAGGELRGLDDRRWLTVKGNAPSYVVIYGPKMAIFSLSGENSLVSVVIEDQGLAETQKIIFKTLWVSLSERVAEG